MGCFATLVTIIMSVAHLASRLRVDVEQSIFAAHAKNPLRPPGNVHWGPPPWHSQTGIPGPPSMRDAGRPPDLASPAANGIVPGPQIPSATLTADRWSHLFARRNRRQPSMDGTNQVSEAIASKAELDLAKLALDEAFAASGSSEKGLLVKAFSALDAAQAAMDDTQVALNTAQAVMDDSQADLADVALDAVGAVMDNTEAAMDNAQGVFDILLRTYEQPETTAHMLGKAEVQNAKVFQAAIIAADGALKKARAWWWYDVVRMEAEEVTEAEIAASMEAWNEASMAVDAATMEVDAATKARMAGMVSAETEAVNKDRSPGEAKGGKDASNKAGKDE